MKNLTAVLKSLMLTVTIVSVTACTSSPYQSASIQKPVVVAPNGGYSLIVDSVQSVWLTNQYGLNEAQKQKQTSAVYAALDSDYGKVIHWYERNAKGAVKAVHGYPQGVGFCRVLFSAVTVNGKTKEFKETACKKHYDSREWIFVRK